MRASPADAHDLTELVVCSLEAWDDVWRRNQFFTRGLLERNPNLRVLFVEPPTDPVHAVATRRRPQLPGLRAIRTSRLYGLRPLKILPRRAGYFVDAFLVRQVVGASTRLGFRHPLLWLNDVTYTPLIQTMGWRALYDVTDDWLLAPFHKRELKRLRRLDHLATTAAEEVVVCSPALERDRGHSRPVTVISNGVDLELFRQRAPRPSDLPPAPTAVYLGTLHESRLDVGLVKELARSSPDLSVVLVGPVALSSKTLSAFSGIRNLSLLGTKDHQTVPGYLQHADVLIVPHVVTPFTESLDPIKAYEYSAVDTPAVATAAAGFREHPQVFQIATRDEFASRVNQVLAKGMRRHPSVPPTWDAQSAEFERVLMRLRDRRSAWSSEHLLQDGE
jgi:glycosyltransferase involved in cell wall biosynthesis